MINSEVLSSAVREATDEAATMMCGLLKYLVGRVLVSEQLTEAEMTYVAGVQVVVLLTTLNQHLESIGSANFELTALLAQKIMECERKEQNQVARLSKLIALLTPLPAFESSSAS